MKNAKTAIGASVGWLVVLSVTGALAQDWPQWRGPNRDGKAAGFAAPAAWPASLVQKWKVPIGPGDASPALLGERLFLSIREGDQEVTLCIDARDGKQVWRDAYAAAAVTGAAARHPGPRSSPAVAEGKVVTLGVAGVLSCLDADTGKVIWRKDPFPGVVPQFFTASSPLVAQGMAIAQLGGKGNGAILAFDLASGEEKWRWAEEGPEYASPALLTAGGVKQVVALTEKSVVGVGLADGKLLWRLPFVTERRAYNAATPIVDGETVIFCGAGRGTKAVKIEASPGGFATKELWSNPDLAPQFNTPVLKDGRLFGLSNRGMLYCLDAATGRTLWLDQAARDRGGFGSIVDLGSTLVALTSSAELVVFKPSGEGYEELAKYQVSDAAVYGHPVIAGNRIFVKDDSNLTLWTVK
ncbi:MAG: PQQ-binding-like beta-propeller repeat protein [Thermoguttaceae bacterium]|jgi:outer membrane protein assembly factor BamB